MLSFAVVTIQLLPNCDRGFDRRDFADLSQSDILKWFINFDDRRRIARRMLG
jgi:hypothetical protein